jgi:integrase/recombinase XerC
MLWPEVDAYLAYRSVAGWSPDTTINSRRVLRRTVRWLEKCGHRRWATVTAADLDALLKELVDRGLRRSSVATCANALRGLGRWLAEKGRVLRNPAEYLATIEPDEMPLPPAPLSEAQVAALFTAVPRRHVIDLRNRLHLELLYSCALRSAETLHLDISDIDLSARTLLVREGKMGKSRLLPLLSSAMGTIAEYLALRRDLLRGPDHGQCR